MKKSFVKVIVTLVIGLVLWALWFSVYVSNGDITAKQGTWTVIGISSWDIAKISDYVVWKITDVFEVPTAVVVEDVVKEIPVVVDAVKWWTAVLLDWDYPAQPKVAVWNREWNTDQLNAYAHANMRLRTVPADATWMTVTLEKDITTDWRNLIIYVATNELSNNRHCGGRILWADLWDVKWSVFTFDLSEMNIQGSACDWDWTKKLNWLTIEVGWYISIYDWNKIQDIVFK